MMYSSTGVQLDSPGGHAAARASSTAARWRPRGRLSSAVRPDRADEGPVQARRDGMTDVRPRRALHRASGCWSARSSTSSSGACRAASRSSTRRAPARAAATSDPRPGQRPRALVAALRGRCRDCGARDRGPLPAGGGRHGRALRARGPARAGPGRSRHTPTSPRSASRSRSSTWTRTGCRTSSSCRRTRCSPRCSRWRAAGRATGPRCCAPSSAAAALWAAYFAHVPRLPAGDGLRRRQARRPARRAPSPGSAGDRSPSARSAPSCSAGSSRSSCCSPAARPAAPGIPFGPWMLARRRRRDRRRRAAVGRLPRPCWV